MDCIPVGCAHCAIEIALAIAPYVRGSLALDPTRVLLRADYADKKIWKLPFHAYRVC